MMNEEGSGNDRQEQQQAARGAGSRETEPGRAESRTEEPRGTESRAVEPRATESRTVEPRMAESRAVESRMAESRAVESRATARASDGINNNESGAGRATEHETDPLRRRRPLGVSRTRRRPEGSSYRKRSRRKTEFDRRTILMVVGAVALVLLGLAIGIAVSIYNRKYRPSSVQEDLDNYFDVAGDNVQVYLNYEKQKNEKEYLVVGRYADGHIYLPADWVTGKLNRRFYWAEDVSQYFYSLPGETLRFSASDQMDDGSSYFFQDGRTTYLNVDWISTYTDMTYRQHVDDGHKRIYIWQGLREWTRAQVKRKESVRVAEDIHANLLTTLRPGMEVTILDAGEGWTRVLSDDGFIGYMRNKRLSDIHKEELESTYTAPEFTYKTMADGKKVELGFHQVTLPEANAYFENLVQNASGMNVVAPTWFVLSDSQGNFVNYADSSYTAKAHAKGYQVWATVNNFDIEGIDMSAILKNSVVRAKLIAGLIAEALGKGIDGLNIDFELIPERLARDYVQFMREISIRCRQEGLVLSVDCYVPYPYNSYYDLEELGTYCDYVVIMCYDEHYSGSEEPGSVASISYTDRGINEALKMMPKERIIIAVPFYTRLWTTRADGSLRSQSLGIGGAWDWVQSKNVKLEWLDSVGQYYGSLDDEDGHKEIWMEESESMKLKIAHIREADVAGVAAWKLGLESEGFWENLRLND